jgi:hypothetical protein
MRGRGTVRPDQNFFDLSGHSLLALQIVRDLQPAIPAPMTIRTIYEYPTPAALSAHLAKQIAARAAAAAARVGRR